MATNGAVVSLLDKVARQIILPRFGRLREDEVSDKGAGELVTSADRDSEQVLAEGLRRIVPEARVIGEEACAADPALLDALAEGLVWLIDPIDGTANFAGGREPFAVMIALLEDGVVQESWILEPLSTQHAHACAGGGATLNGRRVVPSNDRPPDGALVGIVSGAFVPEGKQKSIERLRERVGTVRATKRCAGHEYPLVASGNCDFALYWRTLPWDHAAGTLLVREAGGVVCRLDGTEYRPAESGVGLLVARNPAVAKRVLEMLG